MDPPGRKRASTTDSSPSTSCSTSSTTATLVTNDSSPGDESTILTSPGDPDPASSNPNNGLTHDEEMDMDMDMYKGRRSKRRSSQSCPPVTKKAKTSARTSTTSSTNKVSRAKQDEILDMSWICAACGQAECAMDCEADLLVCEGPCRRLFHGPCAGLAQLPEDDWQCQDCLDGRHLCGFCQDYGTDQVDVFKCQKPECGRFFHEACLEMQNIAMKRIVTATAVVTNSSSDNNQEPQEDEALEGTTKSSLRFTCPAHWCWTCTQDLPVDTLTATTADANNTKPQKGRGKRRKSSGSNAFCAKNEKRLFPCLLCPTSYHLTCIPPSAKFHELALLCHEHASNHELPVLDETTSLQCSVEAAVEKKFKQIQHQEHNLLKTGKTKNRRQANNKNGGRQNPFFPAGVVVDRRTVLEQEMLSKLATAAMESPAQNINLDKSMTATATMELLCGPASSSDQNGLLFGLPADIQEEVHSKPPVYKHVNSLKYYPENRPKKIPGTRDICNCVHTCDDHCLNRLLYTECFGNKGASNANGKHVTNCRLGPNCGNRRLALKQHVKKCKPQREKGRGWGLVTHEKVDRGALVQEYLGDVIDEKAKEERLKQWNGEHPNDPNFYIMCLSQGWYVDARETANMARFINHSCDPNCILLCFNVGGYMRDGIFALRDIQPGEFLSYDYHFDTKQGDRFVCRCGSANCRGTMKEQQLKKDAAKKTKSQLWEEAKQKLEKDKEFLAQVDAHEKHNAEVSSVLPGTNLGSTKSGDKLQWTSNGLQDKDWNYVRRSRVFLWRTAVIGSNFAARWVRVQRGRRVKQSEESLGPHGPRTTMDVLAMIVRASRTEG
jgi:SET domain